MQQGQERLLHLLEGNGKPGLLERMSTFEHTQNQHGSEIDKLVQATQNLQESVGVLGQSMTEHVNPHNLQHATIARMIVRDPKGTVKWLGWVVAGLVLLGRSNILDQAMSWLAGGP